MRKLLFSTLLAVATASGAAGPDPFYLSFEVRHNEVPMMEAKLRIADGNSMVFQGADDLRVQITARSVEDAADVQFRFTRPDGTELFGQAPRLLAKWDQLATISVVNGTGERYHLALTPSREPGSRPPLQQNGPGR